MQIKTSLITLNLLMISSHALHANQISDQSLFDVLKVKDNEMFEQGFNQCDLDKIAAITHQDFEFFHDISGVQNSKKAFIHTIKAGPCESGHNKLTRQLQADSLKVYPLRNEGVLYGAIQSGVHQFGITTAKFTHLWLKEADQWKLSKVLSYDHQKDGFKVEASNQVVNMTANQVKKFMGDYQFSPDFTLSVIADGNKLFGDSQGQKVEITAISDHVFVATDNSAKIVFKLDDKGSVTGMTMVTEGGEMVAEKVK